MTWKGIEWCCWNRWNTPTSGPLSISELNRERHFFCRQESPGSQNFWEGKGFRYLWTFTFPACMLSALSSPWRMTWTFFWLSEGMAIRQQEHQHGSMSIKVETNHLGMHACVLNRFSHVWLWTVARQALLFMGFSRQEYWSGLPCPPPVRDHTFPFFNAISYMNIRESVKGNYWIKKHPRPFHFNVWQNSLQIKKNK